MSGGWEAAEEVFWEEPKALAYLVEDLMFKGKKAEALSIGVWSPTK